jgi:hypothetical protein
VIFAIRTRRIPFFRSRPSLPLALAALAVVTIGAVLPYTGHLARILGFRPLPGSFFPAALGDQPHHGVDQGLPGPGLTPVQPRHPRRAACRYRLCHHRSSRCAISP